MILHADNRTPLNRAGPGQNSFRFGIPESIQNPRYNVIVAIMSDWFRY